MGLQNYGYMPGTEISTSATNSVTGQITDMRTVGAHRPQIGAAKGPSVMPTSHHKGSHSLGQGINSSTAHLAGQAITRSPLSP
jgi:hypothetical protein